MLQHISIMIEHAEGERKELCTYPMMEKGTASLIYSNQFVATEADQISQSRDLSSGIFYYSFTAPREATT